MNIKIEITEAAAKDIEDMKVIIIDKPNAMAATLTNSILAIVAIAIIDYSSNNNSTAYIPNLF
jgi:predicted GTPase